MVKDDLSFVSEALLGLVERNPDAPGYGERTLETKLKRSHRRDLKLLKLLSPRPGDALELTEIRGLFALANLTTIQSHVLALRIEGYSLEDIGAMRGHTRQGTASVLRQAIKKIARAFGNYRYLGLADVYREELRRGTRLPARAVAQSR